MKTRYDKLLLISLISDFRVITVVPHLVKPEDDRASKTVPAYKFSQKLREKFLECMDINPYSV